jgi:ABC-type uncharacterized transport system ATPase subunit
MEEYIVEMRNIVKDFPGLRANDNITLQLRKGEIHALLGENGAGKSTLMSILFGLYRADSGTILVRGKEVNITNPNVATELGIGMVHQHFKLVHNFTVTENIILGMESQKGLSLDLKTASDKIAELSGYRFIIAELAEVSTAPWPIPAIKAKIIATEKIDRLPIPMSPAVRQAVPMTTIHLFPI